MSAHVGNRSTWLKADARPLDWNGPRDRSFERFSDDALNQPIIEHFERAARRHPERVAIRDSDGALTYGALWDGLSALAETVAARTAPGDLVGIWLPACPTFAVAVLASLAAGRAFVVLDTDYPADWLSRVLQVAHPRLIITLEDRPPGLEAAASTAQIVAVPARAGPARTNWRPARLPVDAPACVLFTSGSTADPKSIVNSQRNLLQRVAQSINAAHINAADRFLTLASPCTIVGVRDVLTALLAGASIHLLAPKGVSAREILNVVRAEDVTILFAFPALLRSILASRAGRASAALRLVRVGGDTILWSDIELLRSWLTAGAAIQSIYAATEAPMMQWFVDEACRGTDTRVPIGYPLPGNALAVVDEDGSAVDPGEIGELQVESPYVSLGRCADGQYFDAIGTRRGGRICRVFHTGDLVRQRADGLIERVGRKNGQVKIRGYRVDLEGVEAAIRQHPGVRDAAALTRTSDSDGTLTLVAYVTARDDASTALIEELKARLASIPAPMRPARLYLLHEIPRLPSSKVDARALAALDKARRRGESTAASDERVPITVDWDATMHAVARAWSAVLRVPVRGPEEDFFESGGDSLKAITFVIELERALGLTLSPTLLNEAPKFGQLCELLRQSRVPRSSVLVTLKPGADRPPVFFIHGAGGNVLEIQPTARRVRYAGAVIGVRARGLAGDEVPHTRVEAMASDYLSAIKERQPVGPYYLCGYSLGGVVAFEIARRLSESGDEVAFVGLFDSLMSPVRWPLRAWPRIVWAHFVSLVRRPRTRPQQPSVWRILRFAPKRAIRVAASALLASARYRAGFYPGRLTLFTPAEREPGLPSLEEIWRKHASSLCLIETRGNHATMLAEENAQATAAHLAACLPIEQPVRDSDAA